MRIAKINISSVSDDFAPGISDVRWQPDGRYIDLVSNYGGRETKESVRFDQIVQVEEWDERIAYRTATSVTAGVVGYTIFGDLGGLAGLYFGGRHKQITFKATLLDGRSFVADAPSSFYKKIQKAIN